MCGILYTNHSNVNKSIFERALRLMGHRGPDATGVWMGEGHIMGHNRLKVIDLDDRSNQPFHSHDGRYVAVFNGEIYNFKDLAQKYNIERFTTSDTEVLVALYARLGPSCLKQLVGMFTIVILDRVENRLFVARDRLGVKPLYMTKEQGRLSLASEMAGLLALVGDRDWDEVGIRQYRKLRTFFNGKTIYRGVSMFPAGHYMLDGKLVRYWEFPEGEQDAPSVDEVRELVSKAILRRKVSDVPIGSYLSGGLDSTVVAALAGEPHTWTVGFEGHNEFSWARIAAQKFGSRHHEILIEPEEFVAIARNMILKRREPLSVPNEVLLYKMTCEVKKYNTVVMSGEGADELFFGYDRIFRWANGKEEFDLTEFDSYYSYGDNKDLEIIEDAVAPFKRSGPAINTVAAFFQVAHLHGLLRRLDNSTMLCAVEARVPFVDEHALVERMAGVPFSDRMPDGVVKGQLKLAFKDILPSEVIMRKKVGFPVPLDKIPLGVDKDLSPMDRWLQFNLNTLMG